MTPVESEARRIAVALADAHADLRASEAILAAIVRAWEAASPDDSALADALVPGLRDAIEEARDGRAGKWWR